MKTPRKVAGRSTDVRTSPPAQTPAPRISVSRVLVLLGLGVLAFGASFAATKLRRNPSTTIPPPGEAPVGMVWIPGGEFTMGTDSEESWPEERPAHRVRVDGCWMDATEVTNARFREFVDATGYVTTAEKPPLVEEILKQSPPGTPPPPPEKLVPGSLVFRPTAAPVQDFNN